MPCSHQSQSASIPKQTLEKRIYLWSCTSYFSHVSYSKQYNGEIHLGILKCIMSQYPSWHYSSQNIFKFTQFIKELRHCRHSISIYWLVMWAILLLMKYELLRFIMYLIYIWLKFTKSISHLWSFRYSIPESSPPHPGFS
jgi:hypothetical protein